MSYISEARFIESAAKSYFKNTFFVGPWIVLACGALDCVKLRYD